MSRECEKEIMPPDKCTYGKKAKDLLEYCMKKRYHVATTRSCQCPKSSKSTSVGLLLIRQTYSSYVNSCLKASYVTGTVAHVSSFVSYPNTILQVKNVAAQDLNPEVLVVGSEF